MSVFYGRKSSIVHMSYVFFIHSFVDQNLGWLDNLAGQTTKENTDGQAFLCCVDLESFGTISRSAVAGSHGGLVLVL